MQFRCSVIRIYYWLNPYCPETKRHQSLRSFMTTFLDGLVIIHPNAKVMALPCKQVSKQPAAFSHNPFPPNQVAKQRCHATLVS